MMELSWALFEIDSTPVGAPVGVFQVLCERGESESRKVKVKVGAPVGVF